LSIWSGAAKFSDAQPATAVAGGTVTTVAPPPEPVPVEPPALAPPVEREPAPLMFPVQAATNRLATTQVPIFKRLI
jgi:hypothetical protein